MPSISWKCEILCQAAKYGLEENPSLTCVGLRYSVHFCFPDSYLFRFPATTSHVQSVSGFSYFVIQFLSQLCHTTVDSLFFFLNWQFSSPSIPFISQTVCTWKLCAQGRRCSGRTWFLVTCYLHVLQPPVFKLGKMLTKWEWMLHNMPNCPKNRWLHYQWLWSQNNPALKCLTHCWVGPILWKWFRNICKCYPWRCLGLDRSRWRQICQQDMPT